jgi:hypothetical protein
MGSLRKLRLLGFDFMTHGTGTLVASAYGLALLVVVLVLLVRIARREGNPVCRFLTRRSCGCLS